MESNKIYALIEIPVIGELSPDTKRYYTVLCDSCNLKELLEKEKIKGVEFVEIKTKHGQDFALGENAYLKKIPQFFQMQITGRADGPESWMKKVSVCSVCGRTEWALVPAAIRSSLGPSLSGTGKDITNPLPINVYPSSWQGDDVFLLTDNSSVPVITERFLTIVKSLGNDGIFARPAYWV